MDSHVVAPHPAHQWAYKGVGKGGGCGGSQFDGAGGMYLAGGGYMAPDGSVHPYLV